MLQLEDYLRACKKAGLAFLVITRAPLTAEEGALLKKYGQRRAHYMDLVQYLRDSRHPATEMLYDYFKEEGLRLFESCESLYARGSEAFELEVKGEPSFVG